MTSIKIRSNGKQKVTNNNSFRVLNNISNTSTSTSSKITPLLTSDPGTFSATSVKSLRDPWHLMDGTKLWSEALASNRVGWMTDGGVRQASVTWDMQSTKTITSIIFWNYQEYDYRNIAPYYAFLRATDDVEISISNDNTNFTTLASDSGKMAELTWTTDIPESNQVSGRYLKITIDNLNIPADYVADNVTGLLEIEVYGY